MSSTNKELSNAVLALEQINLGIMQQHIDTLSQNMEEEKNLVLNHLDQLFNRFNDLIEISEEKSQELITHIFSQTEFVTAEADNLNQQLDHSDQQLKNIEEQVRAESQKMHDLHESHVKELEDFDQKAEEYAGQLQQDIDTWLDNIEQVLEFFEEKENVYNTVVQGFVQLGEKQLKETAEDIKTFDLKIQTETENIVNQLTNVQDTVSTAQQHLLNIKIIAQQDTEEEQIQKVFEYLSQSGIKFEDVFGGDMKKVLDITSDITEVIEKIKPILDIIRKIKSEFKIGGKDG